MTFSQLYDYSRSQFYRPVRKFEKRVAIVVDGIDKIFAKKFAILFIERKLFDS